MKIIEKPVSTIEKADNLKDIMLSIVSLLKSLKNIYESSNFYKEARIVSFVDRLLDCIMNKIKERISIHKSVIEGIKSYESYSQTLQLARNTIVKFQENLFVAHLIEKNQEFYFSNES